MTKSKKNVNQNVPKNRLKNSWITIRGNTQTSTDRCLSKREDKGTLKSIFVANMIEFWNPDLMPVVIIASMHQNKHTNARPITEVAQLGRPLEDSGYCMHKFKS